MSAESEYKPKEKFEICTNTLNYLSVRTGWWWGSQRWIDAIQESGYVANEHHPIRFTPLWYQLGTNRAVQTFQDSIKSGHQSIRGIGGALNLAKAAARRDIFTLESYYLFRYSPESLKDLVKLQKVLERKIPVVMYPNQNGIFAEGSDQFGQQLVQPTTEVMKWWGVTAIDGLIEQAKARGCYFCLDTLHSRILNGIDLTKDPEARAKILEHTSEVHVRADTDVQKWYSNFVPGADMKAIIDNDRNSLIGQFLGDIGKEWNGGRVVMETPYDAMNAVYREKTVQDENLSVSQLLEYHKRSVNNTLEFLQG